MRKKRKTRDRPDGCKSGWIVRNHARNKEKKKDIFEFLQMSFNTIKKNRH
jgi:hypothetical protein